MKKVGFVVIIALLCSFTSKNRDRNLSPISPIPLDIISQEIHPIEFKDVSIPIDDIFAPKGYDSNDSDVIIYVSGRLPSPCYRRPKASIFRNGNSFSVLMTSTIVKNRNEVCIAMTIPFLGEIKLGKLPEGNYSLTINGTNNIVSKAQWQVEKPSRSSIDNYIYAQVKNVRVGNDQEIIIEGENASDCIELDRIESIFNGNNTYAILPIMRQIKPNCPEKPSKFAYGFTLPKHSIAKKVLIHVRSVDGTSVNHLIGQN